MANTSQKLWYKIVTWVVLVIAGVVLLMGGVFLLTGSPVVTLPNELCLTAAGLKAGLAPDQDGEYHLSVYQKKTALAVSTSPRGSSSEVTFNIEWGDSFINVEAPRKSKDGLPSIWPGDFADLVLKEDEHNGFYFNNLQPIRIRIKSDQQSAVLNVKICLPADQVKFDFQLTSSFYGFALTEISAQDYMDIIYGGYENAVGPYKFNAGFSVLGNELSNVTIEEPEEVSDIPTGIKLLGFKLDDPEHFSDFPSGFANIFIPRDWLEWILQKPNASITARFKITVDYYGKHIDFFELRIVK